MNITTRQLAAFVHAARQRSFTRAAEHMHISQAGMSLMMRELEIQVGCRLFDRTTRSVALTPAGAALLPVAERALEELSSAVEELNRIGAQVRKTLRVGATPLVAAHVMPLVQQALKRLQPEVSLRILDSNVEELQRSVASGDLDCGVGPFSRTVSGIERELLFRFDLLYVCAARSGRAARTHPVLPSLRWSDLREAPDLSLTPDNPIQELIARELKRNGIPANRTPLTFNNIETVIGMASGGAGAAIIPSIALAMCWNNALEVARLTAPALNVGLYLITKRGRAVPAVLDQFTSVVMRVFGDISADSARTCSRQRT